MFSYNSICYGRNQAYIAECEFRALEVTFTPRNIWTLAHSPSWIREDLFFVLSLAVPLLKSSHCNYLLDLCHWTSSRENELMVCLNDHIFIKSSSTDMHFDKEIIDLSWQKTEKSREGKDLEIQKTLGDMTTLVNVLHIHGGCVIHLSFMGPYRSKVWT